jgi:hypothetical protein
MNPPLPTLQEVDPLEAGTVKMIAEAGRKLAGLNGGWCGVNFSPAGLSRMGGDE